MKKGSLSSYFDGVAGKILAACEVNQKVSHQHEFNGVQTLKALFGEGRKERIKTKFLYLDDNIDPVEEDGFLTWYDARENHPSRSEYRLYFSDTKISQNMDINDLWVIAKLNLPQNHPSENTYKFLIIVAKGYSTYANQLQWLFGLENNILSHFSVRDGTALEGERVSFTASLILESIGIAVDDTDDTFTEILIRRYKSNFPSTKEFSEFARYTCLADVHPDSTPDEKISLWMEREEILFKTFEKHIIAKRLQDGFYSFTTEIDTDLFIEYALSVLNRRKSRVGHAFENHLEFLFRESKLHFSRGAITENRAKPDFLFPGKKEYDNANFPQLLLTMLGVKSTCKDRWRQVLTEANRVKTKHLITLEPGISLNQTAEMQEHNLRLVVPQDLHKTYQQCQQNWLLSVADFVNLVQKRQSKAGL
ncbi:MAG: type II restriction endonuclease [Planctomycetia bacterium]|nr:type II restriction endonuclease [Planctomycetia bacterium]